MAKEDPGATSPGGTTPGTDLLNEPGLGGETGESEIGGLNFKSFNTVQKNGGDLKDTLIKNNILYICKDSDTLNYYCDIYGKVFTYGNGGFTEVGTYITDVNLNDQNSLITRQIRNIQIKLNDGTPILYVGEGLNKIDPLSLLPADDGSDRIHTVFEKSDSYYLDLNNIDVKIASAYVNNKKINFKYHVITGIPDGVADV